MLWLLLCLLPLVGSSRTVAQDVTYKERHDHSESERVLWAQFGECSEHRMSHSCAQNQIKFYKTPAGIIFPAAL